uniref:Sodium/calcium exchanger membrane region domain-containing protein n=1 Tax=Meloidogyne incognita TaxID=6306 RepID=A0A914MWA4_MELIC
MYSDGLMRKKRWRRQFYSPSSLSSSSSFPTFSSSFNQQQQQSSKYFSNHFLLFFGIFTLLLIIQPVNAGTNCTEADSTRNCVDGMLVPIWKPFLDLGTEDRFLRGIIYFFVIAYLFLGVSIVADRFMSSIEVITSMERTVVVKRLGLPPAKVKVRIWNDTVSNLTLMALGSSAPEILLSIIEVVGKGFEAGDLGPNTIVGSAAFNLFMIIAICVSAVPPKEVRRQKHLDVFFVTATWSIFAYVWLWAILAYFSPGVIEIWEGLVTFAFFPITVLTAWIADIKLIQAFCFKFI